MASQKMIQLQLSRLPAIFFFFFLKKLIGILRGYVYKLARTEIKILQGNYDATNSLLPEKDPVH